MHAPDVIDTLRAGPVRAGILACTAVLLGGCGSLPALDLERARSIDSPARFTSAGRVLTASRSKAIVDRLKKQTGDTDILGRHITVAEAIATSPMVTGNRVVLLEDGPATYAAMFAAIRNAKSNIDLATYIFEADDIGKQFAQALAEKRRQGIGVNVIYDSVGSRGTPQEFFDGMRAAGLRVVEFNPVNPLRAKGPWTLNNRGHRKLLIVDDGTVFVGGVNISSVYSKGSFSAFDAHAAGPASAGWRDTHIQIDGPVVAEYRKLFAQAWQKQKGEPLTRNDAPALTPKGGDIVQAIGSTPDGGRNEYYLMLISALSFAERNIYLTNAYFVPDAQFLEALCAAARRGVDVRLVLPGTSDFWMTYHAGRSHYADLLRAGVRIYERRGALLHAKTATIDGVWSSVGSTNLDWRSFLHNDEADAAILSRDFAVRMAAMFARDLKESDSISAEAWERRPLAQRVKEWSARLLERLL